MAARDLPTHHNGDQLEPRLQHLSDRRVVGREAAVEDFDGIDRKRRVVGRALRALHVSAVLAIRETVERWISSSAIVLAAQPVVVQTRRRDVEPTALRAPGPRPVVVRRHTNTIGDPDLPGKSCSVRRRRVVCALGRADPALNKRTPFGNGEAQRDAKPLGLLRETRMNPLTAQQSYHPDLTLYSCATGARLVNRLVIS